MEAISQGIIVNKEVSKNYIKTEREEPGYNGWSWDLSLGKEVYISSNELPQKLKWREPVVIRSGDFALLITEEEVILPNNIMAFISIKFTYKKKGLINVSGFHVDPSYKGRLIFSVYNAGPNDVILRRGDKVFMIFFQKMEDAIDEQYVRREGHKDIPSDMVSEIKGVSTSLSNNSARIDKLDFYFKIMLSAIIALFTVVIGGVIKLIGTAHVGS